MLASQTTESVSAPRPQSERVHAETSRDDLATGLDLARDLKDSSHDALSSLWRLFCAELELTKTSLTLLACVVVGLCGVTLLAWASTMALIGYLLVSEAGWGIGYAISAVIVIQLTVGLMLSLFSKSIIQSIGLPRTEKIVSKLFF